MAKIIIYIIFCIIYRITTNENAPSFSDERDKLIELKAERNSHWVFCLGFLLAMASQVMHMAPSVMFIVLILSGFVSDIFGEVSQLYFYRRGV
jgi:VanZ family protein